MLNIEKYLAKLMSLLITVISFVPAFMYSYIFANFFTMYLFQWVRPTYRQIGSRNQNRKNIKKVLDIGTATGDALSTIVDDLKEAHILGIDYNEFYVPAIIWYHHFRIIFHVDARPSQSPRDSQEYFHILFRKT